MPASPSEAPTPRPAVPSGTQANAGARLLPEPAAKPSFDIVRVDAGGAAVIAGRAEPGAEVTIRDDGQELGHIKADTAGQWVFLPPNPLTVGSRELTLSERTAEGSELRADASVLLVVPDRKAAPAISSVPPLAVLTPEMPSAQGTVVLQRPPSVGLDAGAHLGLDAVQYDDRGSISFTGSAPSAAPVRVYVDNRPIGDAAADREGRWSFVPTAPIGSGRHHVRVDQLAADGHVIARVELPFVRETTPESAVPMGHVVVQPGESLWRLARHAYGAGIRYTVIYQANRDQIREPRLIYPGQNFELPQNPRAKLSPARAG